MQFKPVDRLPTLDPETFQREYVQPRRPVVLTEYTHQWPAYQKWSLDYLKQEFGTQVVPVYDGSKADGTKKMNQPDLEMTFAEYLDELAKGPTPLRIFAFNVKERAPQLLDDYRNPEIGKGFLDRFPMLFFGGKNSKVFLHYDIDMPDLYHTHFGGRKRCLLFDHDQTPYLYKLPLSFHANEDLQLDPPNYEKWPALKHVVGYETQLNHGDLLYMPTGMWHFMHYLDGSFSLTQRAMHNYGTLARGAYNVLVLRHVDNMLRRAFGPKWFAYKERESIARTHAHIQGK